MIPSQAEDNHGWSGLVACDAQASTLEQLDAQREETV